VGAEAAAGGVEVAAGRDAAAPGTIWASRNSGSNDSASAIANHPSVPARKRFKPSLKPDRSPDAHLIIIETEEILVAAVLAVQVINPGAQPPGNQHVNRRLDKPVIIIPRRTDVVLSSEVIRVFIAATQAEVKAVEQTLLKAAHNVGVREILISKKPGIVNPPAGRKIDGGPFKWMMGEAKFKHGCR